MFTNRAKIRTVVKIFEHVNPLGKKKEKKKPSNRLRFNRWILHSLMFKNSLDESIRIERNYALRGKILWDFPGNS